MRRLEWLVIVGLVSAACGSEPPPAVPAPGEVAPPPQDEASAVMSSSLGPTAQWSARLPQSVAGFELKSSKEKPKGDRWIEHSATYVRGDDEVKVVINEHRDGIDPEWRALLETLDATEADGRSFSFHEKEDKRSWMTIVPPRFRVDVKSRSLDRDALLEVAKGIPHPTEDWLVTP